jgi:hypothetical protein
MEHLKNVFQETGRGLLIGVGLTCLAQGLVAAIAYLCLRIPRWYDCNAHRRKEDHRKLTSPNRRGNL